MIQKTQIVKEVNDKHLGEAKIAIYNSMAEFYASLGGTLDQDVDFTIHRLEEVHGDIPLKSPLFRANYYSIPLLSLSWDEENITSIAILILLKAKFIKIKNE